MSPGYERWLPWALVGLGAASALMLLWFFPVAGDDAYHHAVLAVEQLRCLRHGSLWPLFHPDWNGGTGSFLPAIYSPIVLFLDAGLLLISGEATRAVSISLVVAVLVAAVLMRYGRTERTTPWWVLMFAPYLLVNVFARATVTETWALAGVAGALPALLPPGVKGTRRGPALLLLGSFAIGCQPIMLILVAAPLLVTWLATRVWGGPSEWKWTAAWAAALAASSAIFWAPPLLLIGNFDRAALFSGAYGWRGHFATSLSGNAELGPALLAIWIALGIVVTAGAVVLRRRITPGLRAILAFVVVCLILASPLSLPLWFLPGLSLVQFPWRFLGPASIATVCLLGRMPVQARRVLGAVFVLPLLLVPLELDTGFPPLTARLSRHGLATACAARYAVAPLLPLTPGEYAAGFHPLSSLRAERSQPGRTVVAGRDESCSSRTYEVSVREAADVLLPVQWWPGWEVLVDGRRTRFVNRSGLIAVSLAAGDHDVLLELGPSSARRIGGLVSLLGILFGAVLYRRQRRAATSSSRSSSAASNSGRSSSCRPSPR